MSLALSSPVCFRDSLGELFLLRRREMIDVNALKHSRSHDGLHDLLLHLLRVQLRGAEQIPQARLVLDLPSILIILPRSRLSIPRLLRPPPARLLIPSQFLRRISSCLSPLRSPHRPPVRLHTRLQIRNAHRPHLIHQPLILAITALSMPPDRHRRYHIITRLILLPHLLLLRLTLPSPRIRLQEHLQQRRDRSIRPRASDFGAALWASIRMWPVLA